MKKIFLLVFMLLFAVTLTACNSDKSVEKTKELIPVESIVLKDSNGNDVVVTEETPFYDLLDLLNIREIEQSYIAGKEISFDINVDISYLKKNYVVSGEYLCLNEQNFFCDFEMLDDETNENLSIQRYAFFNGDILETNYESKYYSKLQFGNELYIYGYEYTKTDYVEYKGDYTFPPVGSKIYNMKTICNNFLEEILKLNYFQVYPVLKIEYYAGDYYNDYDIYSERSFKLYENYIVFEQIDPFGTKYIGDSAMTFSYYERCKHNEANKVVQTLKYNLETNSIEEYSLVGNTFSSVIYPCAQAYVNINIKLNELSKEKYERKSNILVSYTKLCNKNKSAQ